jgi:hypothetical protein
VFGRHDCIPCVVLGLLFGLIWCVRGTRQSPVCSSRSPVNSSLLFLVMVTVCLVNVASQSASHSLPMDMSEL